ncbi:MAG: DUF998 domain-containing protein [Bacteroidota bacterium]|nr:DUF998 domain-containing protein [Bacteroidota bacterium]
MENPKKIIAAKLSMIAIITYQVLLIVLIFLRPDLDPTWHTISEWAIGKYGWVMTLAFFISAISYASLLVAIKSETKGILGRIGIILFFICVVGTFGVGTFTTDSIEMIATPTSRGLFHIIFGSVALMLFPFAALIISLNIARKNKEWYSSKQILLWSAGIPLFGFLCFMLYTAIYVMPMGQSAYGPGVNIGLPPRFAFLTYAIWIVILATQIIKVKQKSS